MSLKDQELALKIEEIVKQYPQYGYRKVFAILRFRMKLPVYRNKVYEIMKQKKLLLPACTTNKKLFKGIPFSLKIEAQRPNQLWGIDMTQIWCGTDGWGYMHAVIDHFDKTLLGYSFTKSCKAICGVMALSEAASKRDVSHLELRSDNGCHYGAKIWVSINNGGSQDFCYTWLTTTKITKGTPKCPLPVTSLSLDCLTSKSFPIAV